MARPISIYRSLLFSLLLVIALLTGAVLVTTWIQARRAVEAVSGTAISRTMDEMDARLQRFFDPAQRGLHLIRDWAMQGRLDFDDTESFSQALGPVIENYPQITSLMLADSTGHERMLLRAGGKWKTRESRAGVWGRTTRWTERDSLTEPARSSTREMDYDCRERPWFKEVVRERAAAVAAADETKWTSPYIFFTTKDPGITAGLSFAGKDGVTRVLAFDVMLKDISEFTRSLAPSESGRTVVLTDAGLVLGLPGTARFKDPAERAKALLKPPSAIGVPVVADATASYERDGVAPGKPFRFESGGRMWWGGWRWVELSSERKLALVVVVPESDLLGDIASRRLWILLATGLVIAFAAWYANVLARRYSRPILELVHESDRIREGDLKGGEPIRSRLVEVQRLALSFDEMRTAVGALLKVRQDLQIARQIQQDTFPAELPALPGYLLEAWSEPAEETGGDTYDLFGVRQAAGDGTGTSLIVQENPDTALLLLADATGHGIGPALSVTQVRAMLRMAARAGSPIDEIALHMNEQLFADLADDRFVTAWVGQLDATTNRLVSFSAGQAPLLHYVAERNEVVQLGSDAPPLGVIEDLPMRAKQPIELAPGDLFAIISDGIFEAMSPERNDFGVDRVVELILANSAATPEEILARLREAVNEYTGGAAPDDDRTAILIKRL